MSVLIKPKVLFEDNHLIIVSKPAGYLSQGDKTRDMDMLTITKAYIKQKYNKPGEVFLGLPHRLDRPVSGTLMFCRTSKALTRVTKMFKDREIEKIYHAIVTEIPNDYAGSLKSYLKKEVHKNKTKTSTKAFVGAKHAVLHYKLIGQIKDYSLLEIQLETGRPHQIRAQLTEHKMPILGDAKYKPQKPLEDKSIALHARSLSFIHPVKKEPVRITAKYPNQPWWNTFA